MRVLTVVLVAMLLPVLFLSCGKSNLTVAVPVPVYWNIDTSLMPTLAAIPISPSQMGTDGVLIANKQTGIVTDTSGDSVSYNRDWEAAILLSVNGSGVSGVAVNSTPLVYSELYNLPMHTDSGTTWNSTTTNQWSVSGSTPFSVNVPGAFPEFSGQLPDSISTSGAFSFSFNALNTIHGDSAYIVLYGAGSVFGYSNVTGTANGVAKIDATSMSYYHNDYVRIPGGANKVSYGGQMMIVVYNYTTQTFNGRVYAFVNQREYFKTVTFY